MKKIDVIITPFELDTVKKAIYGLGIQGMTITEVKVSREGEIHNRMFTRADPSLGLIPKLKLEIIVSDSVTGKVIEMINKVLNKNSGNDNLFVSHIENAVRIRTGQKGEDAIT